MSKAIAGPRVNQTLTVLPSVRISWKKWGQLHPNTMVLSDQTGFARDYRVDPYAGYYRVGSLMFPVGPVRKDLSAKTRVLGVVTDGAAKAYALERLRQQPGLFKDRVGQVDIRIEVSSEGEVLSVQNHEGVAVNHMYLYWFAWQAFYPHTDVHSF